MLHSATSPKCCWSGGAAAHAPPYSTLAVAATFKAHNRALKEEAQGYCECQVHGSPGLNAGVRKAAGEGKSGKYGEVQALTVSAARA